jgi:hypothetical protein
MHLRAQEETACHLCHFLLVGLVFKGETIPFTGMILQNFFNVFGKRVNPGQFFFGGGGSVPAAPKPQKIPEPPPVVIPTPPAPAPPPPPPPTSSKIEEDAAQSQQAADAKRRRGMSASLIAGETGGANSEAAPGTKTLLG